MRALLNLLALEYHMVVIRLRREGNKNRAIYRIVALNNTKRRDGGFLDIIGTYDPHQGKAGAKVDIAKVDSWVSKGAQLSETVASLVKHARKAAVAAK